MKRDRMIATPIFEHDIDNAVADAVCFTATAAGPVAVGVHVAVVTVVAIVAVVDVAVVVLCCSFVIIIIIVAVIAVAAVFGARPAAVAAVAITVVSCCCCSTVVQIHNILQRSASPSLLNDCFQMYSQSDASGYQQCSAYLSLSQATVIATAATAAGPAATVIATAATAAGRAPNTAATAITATMIMIMTTKQKERQ